MKYMYILLSMLFLTACSAPTQDESQLTVHAFKVGKADSFLISYKGQHLLIDTGEDDDGEKIVRYLQQQNITQLDALIITHFDKDHVGGADYVVDAVAIDTIYVPDYESDSKQTEQFLQAVAKQGYSLNNITTDTAIAMQEVAGMMYPPQQLYDGDNNNSLVISLSYGETSFLFAGDMEAERTEAMLADLGSYTFLKMPHHGRFNEQTANLVQTVQPEIALITSSDKNPEAAETVDVLEKIGANIYTTRTSDVEFSSNGTIIQINK